MTPASEICAVCGVGALTLVHEKVEQEYKGRKVVLDLPMHECDHCHSDFATAEDSKRAKRLIASFKKNVDGYLSGGEIRAIRKQYDLTQEQAARLFGGGVVAFSKYENDDVVQSEAMDNLLVVVSKCPQALKVLAEHKKMTVAVRSYQPVQVAVKPNERLELALEAGEVSPRYESKQYRTEFVASIKEMTCPT